MEQETLTPTKEKKANAVDALKAKFDFIVEKEHPSKKNLSVKLSEFDRRKLKDLATEKGLSPDECATYIVRAFLDVI